MCIEFNRINDQSKVNVEICYTEGVFGRGTFSASYFEQKYQENTHRNFRYGELPILMSALVLVHRRMHLSKHQATAPCHTTTGLTA